MHSKTGQRLSATAFVLVALALVAAAEQRKWTDKTGKFQVDAELVKVEDGKAVLRRIDGKQVKVPVEHLSESDQAFLKTLDKSAPAADTSAAGPAIAEIATRFYGDLRNKERTVAQQSLTKKAMSLLAAGPSPLGGLPQPESGNKAITPGNVSLDGETAEIPVMVRAGGKVHKTKLHLRKEGDEWRVFALSATYPDGEKSINFEAANVPQGDVDPLQAILGQTVELAGYTVQGKPVDMSQYKGKVVLVDFWATWCGPCRAEIPNIKVTWDKHHNDGFEVIAISVDEDLKALKAFVAEEKPPWTVVADNSPQNKKPLGDKYGIRAIPAFVLIGKDGKAAAINCRGQRLEPAVAKQLASK
jgi:thiol-disulfide isomerase/thioredoxin